MNIGYPKGIVPLKGYVQGHCLNIEYPKGKVPLKGYVQGHCLNIGYPKGIVPLKGKGWVKKKPSNVCQLVYPLVCQLVMTTPP